MGNNHLSQEAPDPAAVLACALSLWRECMQRASSDRSINLSEAYNGRDEFMRVIVRLGTTFEEWACAHIYFDALEDCWPYLLEAKFGEACIILKSIASLNKFTDHDCLAVALRLRLPVIADSKLPVPIDVSADNPIVASEFRQFRIQTVQDTGDGAIQPFTAYDFPLDYDLDPPAFGFYGVDDEGLLEHIADFKTYEYAVQMARKLAPGIQFPDLVHSRS